MKSSFSDVVTALSIPALAGVGGAFAVFSGFDDAPGGVLIGMGLIIGSVALSLRAVKRRRTG